MPIILFSLFITVMTPLMGWAGEIVLIINEKNEIADLTLDDLSKIYQGRITDWRQGGSIVVVNRPSNSDVRWEFYNRVHDSKPTRKFFLPGSPIPFRILVQRSKEAVVRFIAAEERAVSYVYRNELTGKEIGIRVLEVNGLSGP